MNVALEKKGLNLSVPNYEGPFDMLLSSIQENKIDINAISLSLITTQYLAFLKQEQGMPLNLASEYLTMAACLIELKSKSLLPQSDDPMLQMEEEAIEADLVKHLEEYKFYKGVAEHLKENQQKFMRVYSRYHREVALPDKKEVFLVDVTLEDLVMAFQNVYNTIAAEEEAAGKKFSIEEEISLPQRLEEVVGILKSAKGHVEFEKLFLRRTRLEVVVTFLAVLELARQRMINVLQDKRFGGIRIGWK